MIIGFLGNIRNGKTLGGVKEVFKYYRKGYLIYSNTPLSFAYRPLTIDFLMDIAQEKVTIPDNCVFFIDEIYIWLDSRISGSKRNRIVSYFLLQTGKMGKNKDYGLTLIYTCQFFHQIDRRLRSVTDIAIQCEKKKFTHGKIFKQTVYIFKGMGSYSYTRELKTPHKYYPLYDTRKKIKVEK